MGKNLVTPFRAELEDGTVLTGRYLPVNIVAAERHFKGLGGHELESSFFAAWHSLRATNDLADDVTYARFVDTLVDYLEGDDALEAAKEIEERDAEGEVDPEPDPGTAPGSDSTSPSSPSEQASPQTS